MNETTATEATGAATGGCRTLLRLEGLTLFVGMTMLYAVWGGSWWVYAVLFLVPDVSFAAYLAGPRVGAFVYNTAQLHGTDGADDDRVRAGLAADALDRADLAGAYRHRPRTRLRPEICCRIWLHASRPNRQGCERDLGRDKGNRHCERSEAIQKQNGLLRRFAALRERFAFVAGNGELAILIPSALVRPTSRQP
ncbi:protein of unknown function [Bradyrhizobium erythrophlei]|uniref:Uncharacterized protein n=1 Tax=Bradyrhizobium erythrophlei TaxID=1437360 RepID=A0A1M5TGC9_9BRAD|nr:protein of unknown function [Bradyrhizobium erythrophlei]